MTDANDRAEHEALVWKDGNHDRMVTVGGWMWPVVEETEYGDREISARIHATLRQQGWRPVAGAEYDRSEPGVVRIPVERFPTDG